MWKMINETEKMNICESKGKYSFRKHLFNVLWISGFCLFLSEFFCVATIFPNRFHPNRNMPLSIDLYNNILKYAIIGLSIGVIIWIIYIVQYTLKPKKEKIRYIYSRIFSSNSKLCISCGSIYKEHENICTKCKNDLVKESDYIWIEDNK